MSMKVPGLTHTQKENDHFKKYSGVIKEHKFKMNIHFSLWLFDFIFSLLKNLRNREDTHF